MNLHDLTINQLKRAVAIKEQLSKLGKELRNIFDGAIRDVPKKRMMSASAKKKIAAAQKARWAKLRRAKSARLAKAAKSPKKITIRLANAKLSAKLKAYWAAKKKSGKK